jgi:spermidine synthase
MKNTFLRLHFVIAFILLGGYSISSQVLFVRELLVVFYGNELCLGIIFAIWLSGVSLGAFLSGRIILRIRDKLRFFLILQIAMCLLLPIQVYLIRMLRGFFEVLPGESLSFVSMVYSTIISVLPFSVLLGFAFPFACKIFIRKEEKAALGIGRVYVFESIGSVLGGLVLTFYLILYFHPFEIISILSLVLLTNCLLLSVLSGSKINRYAMGALCLTLIIVYGFLMVIKVDEMNNSSIHKRWSALNKDIDLLESADSRYQNISVAYKDGQFCIFGNGQYITSFPEEYRSSAFAHLVLLEHPCPKEVLLVGGGVSGVIREMLKYPITELHYVELDPKLIRIIKKYLPLKDKEALIDERVRVFYTDGRHFIKESQNKYDMIVLNLPDPSTALVNRFYTIDFFKEALRILKKDGVFVTGISSAANYIGDETGDYIGSVYHSLCSVFPFVLVTPGDNNYFFASSSPNIISSEIEVLCSRYDERHIESKYFSRYHLRMLFPPDRTRFIEKSLREKRDIPLNTDQRPITYFYNLILWDVFSKEKGRLSSFQMLHKINLTGFIFPLVFFLIIRVIYITIRRGRLNKDLRFNCMFAIGTTGFAGMSLEITLIFALQNIYGYVYQMIGLIVAGFMAGLALGGWAINRMMLGKDRNFIKLLTAFEISLSLYALILPYIFEWCFYGDSQNKALLFHSEYLFFYLIGLAGVLTGLQFPLVSKIMLTLGDDPGKIAGAVDSLDHLGAFTGAILTGTVFIPLLGIEQTCFLTGVINIVSVTLLAIYIFQNTCKES